MSINLTMPELTELKPKIAVIGIGGAGGNAVNNMIRSELQGVEFIVANTDAQSLATSLADQRIQLGAMVTEGLGAGYKPEVGRAAAEESMEAIEDALNGCHMAFITAGMGGGTGTGAAPIVAKLAKDRGILTVGVVTKPFQFEGTRRMNTADDGIEELKKIVDSLIIIPNQNLFRVANAQTTFADAFKMADEVLHSGVRGITDLMVMPGLINLDFADVRTVMSDMGTAMMGTGEAEGEGRALEAAEKAVSNPLIDEVSMKAAKGVIINITGGMDLTLFEVDEAANHIRSQVDPDANIIVGSAFHQELDGKMRVSVVATGVGLEEGEVSMPRNQPQTRMGLAVVDAPVEAAEAVQDPIVSESVEELVEAGFEQIDDLITEAEEEMNVAEQAEDAGNDDMFLPPEPLDIPDAADVVGQPDPFAEAAFTNGTDMTSVDDVAEVPAHIPTVNREEKPKVENAPRTLSLFERMAGNLGFGTSTANDEPAPASDVVADDAPSAGFGPMTADERSVPDVDDDVLEIPSFLRR